MRHVGAILALPFMAAVVIPGYILNASRWINIGWSFGSPLFLMPAIGGAFLISIGLVLLYKTISLFAAIGQGTLAPWDPTQKLVVRGVYRYVRNPMISPVLSILLGETIIFGSVALFYWFIIFWLVNIIYIPLSEEPGLEERFGNDYREYKKHVPRWIPRTSPWEAK